MKANPLKKSANGVGFVQCDPSEATHVRLNMPGPFAYRILPVMIGGTRAGTNNWTWNGSVEKPTLKPSILTKGHSNSGEHTCHSWVNEGKVQFLDDCTHEFVGQTVPLLDVE